MHTMALRTTQAEEVFFVNTLTFSYGMVSLATLFVGVQENSEMDWAVIGEILEYAEGWSDISTDYADSPMV